MATFPLQVIEAQRAQLTRRAALLRAGAEHVGWKVGLGIPGAHELIGEEPVFGYLTSASRLASGDVFGPEGVRQLQVDCELAVRVGEESVDAVATGLELCDVGRPPGDFHRIVAGDVFHRAFVLGPARLPPAELDLSGRVHVNGETRWEGRCDGALERLHGVARLLEATGERLRPGDWIICGAICGGFLVAGDHVSAEVGDLGQVEVRIGAA